MISFIERAQTPLRKNTALHGVEINFCVLKIQFPAREERMG